MDLRNRYRYQLTDTGCAAGKGIAGAVTNAP